MNLVLLHFLTLQKNPFTFISLPDTVNPIQSGLNPASVKDISEQSILAEKVGNEEVKVQLGSYDQQSNPENWDPLSVIPNEDSFLFPKHYSQSNETELWLETRIDQTESTESSVGKLFKTNKITNAMTAAGSMALLTMFTTFGAFGYRKLIAPRLCKTPKFVANVTSSCRSNKPPTDRETKADSTFRTSP